MSECAWRYSRLGSSVLLVWFVLPTALTTSRINVFPDTAKSRYFAAEVRYVTACLVSKCQLKLRRLKIS